MLIISSEAKIQEPSSYSVSISQDKHGIGQKGRNEPNNDRVLVTRASAYYAHIFDDILNGGAHPIMVLTDLHQETDEAKLCKGTGRAKKLRRTLQSTNPSSFDSVRVLSTRSNMKAYDTSD